MISSETGQHRESERVRDADVRRTTKGVDADRQRRDELAAKVTADNLVVSWTRWSYSLPCLSARTGG
jgi:hypothetical protein